MTLSWIIARNEEGFGEQGARTLAAPLMPPSKEEGGSSVRSVDAKGQGASSEEAERDAARAAVQQVAGLYIDARRRVESKITDRDVSEVVQEKILSYTNAYITKLQVTKTDRKDGWVIVEVIATVRVAPLLKVLNDARIPTIAFDTATALGQVEIAAREKANAVDVYADLLRRSDDLIVLGVGTPKVDTRLQAPPDKSWLSIPITFKADNEAIEEWRTKFELIATQRAELQVPISQARLNRADQGRSCDVPVLDTSFTLNNAVTEQTFTGTITPEGEHGAMACFTTSVSSTSATLECLGRRFLNDVRPTPSVCKGASCLSLKESTRSIGMRIELIDASGSVIDTIPINFASFPMLNIGAGRSEPSPSVAAFFNYCAPGQQPFYALAPNDAAYGDVLVLPAPGSRFRAYGNFLLPNEVIARTASLRMSVVNTNKGAER